MSDFNGGSEQRNFERLNRMEDVIQSMIEHSKSMLDVIQAQQSEIQDLIVLQKEMRIDIMALFEGNKLTRESNKEIVEMFRQYFEKHP